MTLRDVSETRRNPNAFVDARFDVLRAMPINSGFFFFTIYVRRYVIFSEQLTALGLQESSTKLYGVTSRKTVFFSLILLSLHSDLQLYKYWRHYSPYALVLQHSWCHYQRYAQSLINDFKPLAPNDVYIVRTAQLTSRRCILNIYSTNILTEYFKRAAHSPFFFSLSSRCRLFHNTIFFGSCNIHILYTGCAKILKKIPAPMG